MNKEIETYNNKQETKQKLICNILAEHIQQNLHATESKIWHGAPVWFIEGNPIAGYWVRKNNVRLLFWSGQSFEEPMLKAEGSFKAAEAQYAEPSDVKLEDVTRWLDKAEKIQWDYKNIVKRRGVLERLK